jgi:hypothetical protein
MIVRVTTFKAKPGADVDQLHAARDEGMHALKKAPGLRFRHFFGFKDADGVQRGGTITIWDDNTHQNNGHNKLKSHWSDAEFKDERDGDVDVQTFNIP